MTQDTKAQRPPALFLGLVGIVGVVVAGLAIADVANGAPVGPDAAWHDLLAAHQLPAVVGIALVLNTVGGTFWMMIATAVIVGTLAIFRRFRAAVSIALTVSLAALITTVVKVLVARPRPPGAVVDLTSDSFPSGHTTTAAAIAVAVVLLVPRVWTGVAASVWVVAMAVSRTYLMVHWLSDVVAGAIVGASVALIVAGMLKEPSLGRLFLTRSRQAPDEIV